MDPNLNVLPWAPEMRLYRVVFSLVPPIFSTKKRTASQPITAAVPINPASKKDHNRLLGDFLFGTEIGGYS